MTLIRIDRRSWESWWPGVPASGHGGIAGFSESTPTNPFLDHGQRERLRGVPDGIELPVRIAEGWGQRRLHPEASAAQRHDEFAAGGFRWAPEPGFPRGRRRRQAFPAATSVRRRIVKSSWHRELSLATHARDLVMACPVGAAGDLGSCALMNEVTGSTKPVTVPSVEWRSQREHLSTAGGRGTGKVSCGSNPDALSGSLSIPPDSWGGQRAETSALLGTPAWSLK